MELRAYFDRIGYSGPAEPTVDVLRAIHRRHAVTIAYENVDVYLERRVEVGPDHAFDKIVRRRRGGWCYENNGLLGWALTQVGFHVTNVAGAVMRSTAPHSPLGGHLVLRIDFDDDDTPWIADVGLGGALIEPIPLRSGEHSQGWRSFRLERLAGDEWRFHNSAGAEPRDYDFTVAPVDDDTLHTNCDRLQDDPQSTFRLNLVAGRLDDDSGHRLTGRVVTDCRTGLKRLIDSEDELLTVLAHDFRIELPENVDGLWQRVVARHDDLFGGQ